MVSIRTAWISIPTNNHADGIVRYAPVVAADLRSERSGAWHCIRFTEDRADIAGKAQAGLTDARGHLAMGLAGSGRRRHSWMVARDRLGRRHSPRMAFGLVDLETLGCLHRCADDHAP
jgi:hypothetical protein